MTLRETPHLRYRSPFVYTAIVVLSVLSAACTRGDQGASFSGDVEGLDTLGLRGERLLEDAGREPTSLDSLRASVEDRLDKAEALAINRPPTVEPRETGNPIADRARARGDSMARATANKFAGAADGGTDAAGDTIRGIVTLIGSDPAKQVVLRASDGRTTIAMSGMVTTGMARLAGVDLLVRGVRVSPRDIVVSSYIVRAASGVPAYDGVLSGGDGSWTIKLTDGGEQKRIASLPTALKDHVGERVWVAIQPGSTIVESFGVIPRR